MFIKRALFIATLTIISFGLFCFFAPENSQAFNNSNNKKITAQAKIDTPPSLPRVDANEKAVQTILKIVFGIAGGISVLVITIAGVTYITSSGNPQTTAKAKDTILYAVIGLVISILAFAIVTFVIDKL